MEREAEALEVGGGPVASEFSASVTPTGAYPHMKRSPEASPLHLPDAVAENEGHQAADADASATPKGSTPSASSGESSHSKRFEEALNVEDIVRLQVGSPGLRRSIRGAIAGYKRQITQESGENQIEMKQALKFDELHAQANLPEVQPAIESGDLSAPRAVVPKAKAPKASAAKAKAPKASAPKASPPKASAASAPKASAPKRATMMKRPSAMKEASDQTQIRAPLPSEGLPHTWRVEVRTRQSGKSAGMTDRYFQAPDRETPFRTLKEAQDYARRMDRMFTEDH